MLYLLFNIENTGADVNPYLPIRAQGERVDALPNPFKGSDGSWVAIGTCHRYTFLTEEPIPSDFQIVTISGRLSKGFNIVRETLTNGDVRIRKILL